MNWYPDNLKIKSRQPYYIVIWKKKSFIFLVILVLYWSLSCSFHSLGRKAWLHDSKAEERQKPMLRRMRVHAKYRAHALFGARKGLPTREIQGECYSGPWVIITLGCLCFLVCLKNCNETLYWWSMKLCLNFKMYLCSPYIAH